MLFRSIGVGVVPWMPVPVRCMPPSLGSSVKFRITSAEAVPAVNAIIANATKTIRTCLRRCRENITSGPNNSRLFIASSLSSCQAIFRFRVSLVSGNLNYLIPAPGNSAGPEELSGSCVSILGAGFVQALTARMVPQWPIRPITASSDITPTRLSSTTATRKDSDR